MIRSPAVRVVGTIAFTLLVHAWPLAQLPQHPLSVVLLLDATATTAHVMAPFVWDGSRDVHGQPVFESGRRLPHEPAGLFTPAIREGLIPRLEAGDRVAIGTISRRIRLSSFVSHDAPTVADAARAVLDVPERDRFGPTPIWDAIDAAVTRLASEPPRRAVVIVTDGMPTGNRIGLAALTQRAALADVAVHVILQSQRRVMVGARIADRTTNLWALGFRNPLGDQPAAMFARLAEATGGSVRIDESPSGQIYRDSADGRMYPDPSQGRPRTLVPLMRSAMDGLRETIAGRRR